MGGVNKPLELTGSKPLILHAYERLLPQVSAIMINANRDLAQISSALPKGTAIIEDDARFAGRGPLAGLHACLTHAQSTGHAFVATAAADTPFFPENLIEQLRAPDGEQTIRIARHEGWRHPVFGLWPAALLEDLESFLRAQETNKVMAFVNRHALVEVDIEASGDPFFNVNTPDDLARAGERMRESQS